MTINAIDNPNIDAVAQNLPNQIARADTAPADNGFDAADHILKKATATGRSNTMNFSADTAIANALERLPAQEQQQFLERLITRNTDSQSTKHPDIGEALGEVVNKHPDKAGDIANQVKTLFESGRIDQEDVEALFGGQNLNSKAGVQGLRDLADNVDNAGFSQAAVGGLLDEKLTWEDPQGNEKTGHLARSKYEAALGVAQDALNRGQPEAGYEVTDKLFKDPELRDHMIETMDSKEHLLDFRGESGETEGRSGLLGMVNDLDTQNRADGKMDEYFGGKGAGADRLENIWQASNEHIGGDENAIRESNEYFSNNVGRLNRESAEPHADSPAGMVAESDDRGLISDYVQNVLLDTDVDGDKVGRDKALNAMVKERDQLLETANNSSNQDERIDAGGHLGNLVGSVGAGIDSKFKNDVDDAEEAAGWAATVGGSLVDFIPVIGPLASKAGGEVAENAAREAIKKGFEDMLTERSKPDDANPVLDGMTDLFRTQLGNSSNDQDPAQVPTNAENAEVRRAFDHYVGVQNDEALKKAVYDR